MITYDVFHTTIFIFIVILTIIIILYSSTFPYSQCARPSLQESVR